MPNTGVYTNTGSSPQSVSVGNSSGLLVAQNINRAGLVIVNISSSTMYLAFDGNVAALNAGVALNPNGGVFSMDDYTFNKGQVNAIAHTAGSSAGVQEFYIGL